MDAITFDGLRAQVDARRRELAPLVSEYVRLVEADRRLTELFGPVKRSYTRRAPAAEPPPLTVPGQVAAQALRLHVATVGAPTPAELEGREVAWTTEAPAEPDTFSVPPGTSLS